MKIQTLIGAAAFAALMIGTSVGAQVNHVEHHDAVVRQNTVVHQPMASRRPVVVMHRTTVRPAYHRHCTTHWYNHRRVVRCW